MPRSRYHFPIECSLSLPQCLPPAVGRASFESSIESEGIRRNLVWRNWYVHSLAVLLLAIVHIKDHATTVDWRNSTGRRKKHTLLNNLGRIPLGLFRYPRSAIHPVAYLAYSLPDSVIFRRLPIHIQLPSVSELSCQLQVEVYRIEGAGKGRSQGMECSWRDVHREGSGYPLSFGPTVVMYWLAVVVPSLLGPVSS